MSKAEDEAPVPPDVLQDRVREWLAKEGYPLEFRVAHQLGKAGFNQVKQSTHVHDPDTGAAREIDVRARDLDDVNDRMICVETHVECKFSDHPWVIFTSPRLRLHPRACIVQSIGNAYAEAALGAAMERIEAEALPLFTSNERNGYGGRRALNKSGAQDAVYATLQGVASTARLSCLRRERSLRSLPILLVFPIVVLEGTLFEAYYDDTSDDVRLERVEAVRVHWTGAERRATPHTTIDIVTAGAFPAFARQRRADLSRLMPHLRAATQAIDASLPRDAPIPDERELRRLLQEAAPRLRP